MMARMDRRETLEDVFLSAGVQDVSTNKTANDAKYRAEFARAQAAGHHKSLTLEQYVSLRRAEDGLEPFIPATVAAAAEASGHPLSMED